MEPDARASCPLPSGAQRRDDTNRSRQGEHHGRLWLAFYALVSREFYLTDLFTRFARALLTMATRLNVWLGWV